MNTNALHTYTHMHACELHTNEVILNSYKIVLVNNRHYLHQHW